MYQNATGKSDKVFFFITMKNSCFWSFTTRLI